MKTLDFYLCTLMHGTNVHLKTKTVFLLRPGGAKKALPQGEGELPRGLVGLERMGLGLGLGLAPVLGAVQAPSQQLLCPCSTPQHGIPNPLLT